MYKPREDPMLGVCVCANLLIPHTMGATYLKFHAHL